MSLDRSQDESPLTSVDALVRFFEEAQKPRVEHRVGLEHEKLLVTPEGDPVPYDGPSGIGALLQRLEREGYQAFREAPELPIIALTRGMLTVSLEPGGQLELSGTPSVQAHTAHAENVEHVRQVKAVAAALGLQVVAAGYRPFGDIAAMPWMPKTRYRTMRSTLGGRGTMALDMMLMTATAQASYDWSDEADCVKKTTVAARLAPVLVALYANSPLVRGNLSGMLSYRSHVWSDVDRSRCGFLPSWFDGSFSYRAYVEWALDVPLLFLRRRGVYLTPQLTFRQLLTEGYEGQPALYSDWVDHLSTLFPEVRLKRVLEIRSADSNTVGLTGALAALWRGLLYDPQALSDAADILPALSYAQHLDLHRLAQREGLRGIQGSIRLVDAARALVAVASEGLSRLNAPQDVSLLEPLRQVAHEGKSPAEHTVALWRAKPEKSAVLAALAL